MPIIDQQVWNLQGNEKTVYKHLQNVLNQENEDSYIIHNALLGHTSTHLLHKELMRPDFIILSPKRGICIIEVKDWIEFELDKGHAYLSNGVVELNPLTKCQDYRYNLYSILKKRYPALKLQAHEISCHVVFTNVAPEHEITDVNVHTHYKDYKKTISFKSMFNHASIEENDFKHIQATLNPVKYISVKRERDYKDKLNELDELQISLVNKSPYGHYVISGIPGSGKSIMLASRAIFLAQENPEWKILVLCVNRNLVNKIERDVKSRLENNTKIENVKFKTYHEFLRDDCLKAGLPKKTGGTYREEIEYLKNNCEAKPNWDAILIDEYQDFNGDDIRIILDSCIKHSVKIGQRDSTENLFFVGDKLQQIWGEGEHTWKEWGIHVVGGNRSKPLKTSYRCSSEITRTSLELLRRAGLGKEVDKYYEGTDDIICENEVHKSITLFEGWDREALPEISNRIRNLILKGIPTQDIMIITPRLNLEALKKTFALNMYQGITIETPDKVKGLEAPYVVLYNLSFIENKKNSQKKNAKMVYMCMTRSNRYILINAFNSEMSFETLRKIIDQYILDQIENSKHA